MKYKDLKISSFSNFMTNKKYTLEGLPVVGKSILKVFGRDCIKDCRIYGIK